MTDKKQCKIKNTKDGKAAKVIDAVASSSASVLVIILTGEAKSCDNNINNLKYVFSDSYFTVQVCAVEAPPEIPSSSTLSQEQFISNYNMRKVLSFAAEGPYIVGPDGTLTPQYLWAKLPVLIVKDSSVSNITPSGVAASKDVIGGMPERIRTALNKANQADLYFLCVWNDACNLYSDIDGIGAIAHGSTLKWSVQPSATQAVMYTPSSRDYFREALINATVPLGSLFNSILQQGNMLAAAFVPNLIDFDIDLATSNDDYAKLNECAAITTSSANSSSVATILWFILIIVLVFVVAWAMIVLGPQ